MPHESMLTVEELDQMQDISGPVLYSAEVKRLPIMLRDEQPAYIEAAQTGDQDARHELILNCLKWTICRAAAICRDRPPDHTDMMDLVGHANLKMTEAIPKALTANDPVAYLMSVGAREMNRYCLYRDPLIQRQRDQPLTAPHPGTVSLEGGKVPLLDTVAAPEQPAPDNPEYLLVHTAMAKLSKRHQVVLTAAYGLNGETTRKNEDIAMMLNLPKETVEKYLWRAKKRLAKKLGSYAATKGLCGK